MALLAGCLLGSSACITSPELDVTLHESDRGRVYLERMPDRSFQAAHPIKLSTETVTQVLRGVLVRNDQGFLQNLVAGKPEALRAFTEEDVAFLAPLIADGLMRAASDQQIGFTIKQTGAPVYSERVGAAIGSSEPPLRLAPMESTGGSLYAYGRSLYVTLAQYRHRAERPDTINLANRRLPDESGLANRTVLFVPETAKRPDSYRDARSTDSTLVIDYELLARLPAGTGSSAPSDAASPADSAGTAVQAPIIKGNSPQKDPEVEALRKELEEIKRQLAEPDAQRTPARQKRPTAPQSP